MALTQFPNFTALLSGEGGTELTVEEGLGTIFGSGRAILQARAGAGKTTTLQRLGEALSNGDLHRINLSTVEDRSLLQSTDLIERGLDQVVRAYPGRVLVEIDGLDTVSLEDGQRVLEAVDRVTSRNAMCAIIVSDRLGRRPIREKRWALLGLSTFGDDLPRGTRAVVGWRTLPMYRDLVSRERTAETPGSALDAAITRSFNGDARFVDELSKLVLTSRLTHRSDWIVEEELESAVGSGATQRVTSSGLIDRNEGSTQLRFRHLLVSGYLTARAASRLPELWDRRLFDLLTYGGASFDVLGLLLEMVEDANVDDLVRQVDDWNFYAAAHLLAEDAEPAPRVSDSLRNALLLLLGRRRFTQLPSTRRQVEDALILHGGPLAGSILEARTEAELVRLANEQEGASAEWWEQWLSTFSLVWPASPSAEVISAIASDDGLLGWTAANTLISLDLSDEQEVTVMEIALSHPQAVVRWRAVHVLAGHGTQRSAETCLRVFRSDESDWVQYGALRSFVAIAAELSSASERADLFLDLSRDARAIAKNRKWRREIERSVILDTQPADWPEAVGLLLEKLWAMSDSVEEQDRWRRLSARLRTGWAGGGELV
ncbi:hypothetical protein [uncultured Cellulomonas sp.]|uniref:hypothetical protein n=1 Tax=uncultured Cellulomonas sp. TaxID=189682 RepID=UPI0028E56390|nr:hypothetical protein [uncultured Cellulomonas sp.]